jgi:hypothetical protein
LSAEQAIGIGSAPWRAIARKLESHGHWRCGKKGRDRIFARWRFASALQRGFDGKDQIII